MVLNVNVPLQTPFGQIHFQVMGGGTWSHLCNDTSPHSAGPSCSCAGILSTEYMGSGRNDTMHENAVRRSHAGLAQLEHELDRPRAP
jgi:hypothetical protein